MLGSAGAQAAFRNLLDEFYDALHDLDVKKVEMLLEEGLHPVCFDVSGFYHYIPTTAPPAYNLCDQKISTKAKGECPNSLFFFDVFLREE